MTDAEFEDYQRRRLQPALQQEPEKLQSGILKKAAQHYPLEEDEQIIVAQFLDLFFYGQWFHVPNGGMRPQREGKNGVMYSAEAKKLRAQGVKSGVPDIWIVRPTKGAPGVVIELKRRHGGVVSLEQREWLNTLKGFGWITAVCRGADEAIKFIRECYGL